MLHIIYFIVDCGSTTSSRAELRPRSCWSRQDKQRDCAEYHNLDQHQIRRHAHVERNAYTCGHDYECKNLAPPVDAAVTSPVPDDGTELRVREQLVVKAR